MKKLKEIFRPLNCYFSYGKNAYRPFLWVSEPSLIHIVSRDVGWKDKYDTPRYENPPYIWIHLFGYDFIWYWALPLHKPYDELNYWEQALWYLYYYDTYSQGLLDEPNIQAAKESWPWQTYLGKSSWTDEFLVK